MFYVFERDDAGTDLTGPTGYDLGEGADLFAAGLATLGLGVISTVGRGVQEANLTSVGSLPWVHLKNIAHVMPARGVIDGVHRNRFSVVVDRYVHRASNGLLDRGGHAATACEEVYGDFV